LDSIQNDFIEYIQNMMKRKLEHWEVQYVLQIWTERTKKIEDEVLYGVSEKEPDGIIACSGEGVRPTQLIPDSLVEVILPSVVETVKDQLSELSKTIELLNESIEHTYLSVEEHKVRQDLFRERRGYHHTRKIKPQWKRPVTASARSQL